jgi:hypothetical protein
VAELAPEPAETADSPSAGADVEPVRIRGPLFADEPDQPDQTSGHEPAGPADAQDAQDAEPTQVVHLGDDRPAAARAETTFAPQPPVFDEPAARPAHAAAGGGAGPEAGPGPDADTGWAGGLADLVDGSPEDGGRRERPGWWAPALLGGLVLLLVLSAYGIGRVFSSSVGDADVSTEEPDGVVLGDGGEQDGGGGGDDKPRNQQKGAYQGRTDQATIGGATASCQAPASVDAAGNEVAYPPTNVYDGDLTTAWRCNGTGVGQSLTLTLAEAGRIGEVGLVPGYAKTDPRSGVDRYAENNRLTRVRWTFADGASMVQRLDGSATNRELQTMRIPVTESDSVVLEVLASTRGPRNTMAVSEVRVGRAAE